MLIRGFSMFGRQFRDAAGDDGAGSGSGGDDGQGKGTKQGEGKNKEGDGTGDGSGDDGKDPEKRELLREVMDKKSKLKATEQKLTALQDQLKAWEGLDPAVIRRLLSEQKDAETKRLEAAGEYEKVKQQMVDAHNGEKKTLQQKIDELTKNIQERDSQIDSLTVGSSFSQSKFISSELTYSPSKMRVLFGPHFDRDAEGRIVAYDKSRGTQGRAPLVDGNGNPVAFDEALKRLVDADPDKDSFYKSKMRAGSGSDTTTGKDKNGANDGATGRSRIQSALEAGKLSSGKKLKLA